MARGGDTTIEVDKLQDGGGVWSVDFKVRTPSVVFAVTIDVPRKLSPEQALPEARASLHRLLHDLATRTAPWAGAG